MASRRALLAGAAAAPLLLAACGFQLRQAPNFAFQRLVLVMPGTPLSTELRRQLEASGNIQVSNALAEAKPEDFVLESAGERRERVVVSITPTGQVREFQLRVRFSFRLRTVAGTELLPSTEILRQVDQSYSETEALSKEAEALMLYQNMQADIVQQVMRRLAIIKR
ncbi:MAG: LPS assembly lipoprotein LptE [Proteobacteria bacterium]|jgi:LPS-assembly lipoprotein|nr:LPS assembly lipoprotein LptE [Pseudomonadota bacterium]